MGGLPTGGSAISFSPQADNPMAGAGRERGAGGQAFWENPQTLMNRGESPSSWTKQRLAVGSWPRQEGGASHSGRGLALRLGSGLSGRLESVPADPDSES